MSAGGRKTCSVVIPARNAASYIEETLRSLQTQTVPPQEVLLVNDSSTDATTEIVASLYPSVKILATGSPGGASRSRNLGISHATGERIAFLDADDLYRPEHLESMHASMDANPGAALVFCDTEYMDAASVPMGRVASFPEFRSEAFFGQLLERNRIITTSAAMARKEALQEAGGFDENLRYNEEYDLWLRLAAVHPVSYTARSSLLYRLHPDNISRNREGQRKNEALALQKLSVPCIREGLKRLYAEGVSLELALAAVLFRRQSHLECRSILKTIDPGPDTACQYYFLLGNLSCLEGDFVRAAGCYRQVLQTDPDFAPAVNNLGVASAACGDTAEAGRLFQRAQDLRSGYQDPVFNRKVLDSGGDVIQMNLTYAPLRKELKPM